MAGVGHHPDAGAEDHQSWASSPSSSSYWPGLDVLDLRSALGFAVVFAWTVLAQAGLRSADFTTEEERLEFTPPL